MPRPTFVTALLVPIGALVATVAACDHQKYTTYISGEGAVAIDGDTFRLRGERIRLAGIDAPEMPGHCRRGRVCVEGNPYAAKARLQSLLNGPVRCQYDSRDVYGRPLAQCWRWRTSINRAMVASGHAQPYRWRHK